MQNPGQRTWSINLEITEPGWVEIPAAPDDPAAWVAEQKRELGANWGDDWPVKAQIMGEEMLRSALAERSEEDILQFLVWPIAGQPVAVTVHIGMADAVDLASLAERDTVEAVPIVSKSVGPGVHLSEIGALPEFGTALAQSLLIFQDADGVALVIAVDPTPVQLLAAISKGLQDILDSLRAVDGDGREFAAVQPSGFVVDDDAVWPFDDLAAQPSDEQEG